MAALKNIRHEKAVQAFLGNDGNKSAAYREAYPRSLKWQDGTVWRRASELFLRSDVLGRVQELQQKLEEKEIISKEEIIEDLKQIASVTIKDYIELVDPISKTVHWKPIEEWSESMERACTGIKPTAHGIELTVYGVEYAYNRIAKMMGYDAPIKQDVNVNSSLSDLLK
jgi:hypothetical protein